MKLLGVSILIMAFVLNFSHADNSAKVMQTAMQVCTSKRIMTSCQKAFEDSNENQQKCLSHELLKKLQYVEDADCKVNEAKLTDLDDKEKSSLLECNNQSQTGDKCKDCFETTQCVQQKMKKRR